MNKVKFLYIIIILLVTTNVAVLLNMYLHKPPHPHNFEGPKKIIVDKLEFDSKQADAYTEIIKQHRTSIESTEQKIRTTKDKLFATLKLNKTLKRDSLIAELGVLQVEIESAHYVHFEAIKALCKEDQMERFNELTAELGRLFAPKGMPRKQ